MKTVDAGAALLDERLPGWRATVDTDDLDLGDCSRCVLGQIFGDYDQGLTLLGLNEAQAGRYGFTRRTTTFERLTETWREKVRR